MTNNFNKNFIKILYWNEPWCRNGGFISQSDNCFKDQNNDMEIYFISYKSLKSLKKIKQKIREYFKIGNYSIHTTDTQEESDRVLQILNDNTLYFMSKTDTLYNKYNNFNKYFNKLKEICKDKNIDTQDICITSSSVLSLYNFRDCGDLDIFCKKELVDKFKDTIIDIDNSCNLYPTHFENIIYNPNNLTE